MTGYISGPRWRLPAGTIRRFVIDMGLPVKLLSEHRETSGVTATIFYEIEGDEIAVSTFVHHLERDAKKQ
jgi:hypothetical protein